MNKIYFEREYQQLVREWRCCRTEDEQWEVRARMARLEQSAAAACGFQFADALHEKYVRQIIP